MCIIWPSQPDKPPYFMWLFYIKLDDDLLSEYIYVVVVLLSSVVGLSSSFYYIAYT